QSQDEPEAAPFRGRRFGRGFAAAAGAIVDFDELCPSAGPRCGRYAGKGPRRRGGPRYEVGEPRYPRSLRALLARRPTCKAARQYHQAGADFGDPRRHRARPKAVLRSVERPVPQLPSHRRQRHRSRPGPGSNRQKVRARENSGEYPGTVEGDRCEVPDLPPGDQERPGVLGPAHLKGYEQSRLEGRESQADRSAGDGRGGSYSSAKIADARAVAARPDRRAGGGFDGVSKFAEMNELAS